MFKSRLAVYGAMAALAVVVALVGQKWFAPTQDAATHGGLGIEVTTPGAGPKIGGAFTLVNQDGKTVTDADFLGKYMLVYFGYTFCPDVCPTNLSAISAALDILGEDAAKITPVFVSVDHERDTTELLKEYVVHFHPTMVGLTGTPEQIREAARAYRVYYAKVVEEGSDPDAYLMDHSAISYLMGPDGNFVAHFGHGTPGETMAQKIRDVLAKAAGSS